MQQEIINELRKEVIRQILDYNPETGEFTWKVKVANCIKIGEMAGCLKRGRPTIGIKGKEYFAYRLAFLWMEGEFPKGVVDHIDGNPNNNKWSNLRKCSVSENLFNAKLRSDNISGVKGVSWCKKNRKWKVEIYQNKKRIFLGYFINLEEAQITIRNAREQLHGEFANHG